MHRRLILCYAFTPYHLFSSIYYAMRVNWGAHTDKCLVIHWNLENVDSGDWSTCFDRIIRIPDTDSHWLPKRLWLRCLYGGRLFRFSPIWKIVKRYADRTTCLCFSDQQTYESKIISELRKHAGNTVCMVEEGENTYCGPTATRHPFHKILVRKLLGTSVGNQIGCSHGIDAWFVKHPEHLSAKVPDGNIIRQNDIFSDRQWMQSMHAVIGKALQSFTRLHKKAILWISGPLEEQGISECEELLWLEQIAASVGEDYVIYIKNHPRERTHKYRELLAKEPNLQAVDLSGYEWIPLEFVIDAIRPEILITVISSAALHIYEMGFHTKVIYTYDHFPHIRTDNRILDTYRKQPNIYNVSSLDELLRVVHEEPLYDRPNRGFENHDQDIRFLESCSNSIVPPCNSIPE